MFKSVQDPDFPLRVYDLVYDGGGDYQRFIAILKREKEV